MTSRFFSGQFVNVPSIRCGILVRKTERGWFVQQNWSDPDDQGRNFDECLITPVSFWQYITRRDADGHWRFGKAPNILAFCLLALVFLACACFIWSTRADVHGIGIGSALIAALIILFTYLQHKGLIR